MLDIQDRNLSQNQVLHLSKAMIAVAKVDGMRAEERDLIVGFCADALDQRTFASLADEPFDGAASFPVLQDIADLALQTCLLAGYADGHLSDDELAFIRQMAGALGVGADALAALHDQVRDTLLAPLAALPDAGSVAAVARSRL